MIRLIIALAFFSSGYVFSAGRPAEMLTQAPDMICTDHKNQKECRTAVEAVMLASYSFTSLNEQCEGSTDAMKLRMDEKLKSQCNMAKDATEYLKSLRR